MIYGITIVLNDCNFGLKSFESRVKERYSFERFYTSKSVALSEYNRQLYKVKNQQSIVYGKAELRGRCEFYKATITDGVIFNFGENIKDHKIQQ